MNGLTMKKMFSFFTISVMAISMRAAGNDIAAKLFDQSSGFRLHEGKVRKQKLIFIPEIPGADTGSWRIVWEKGEKILELILKHPIKLPPFESKIRIEMEIECSPGATLLAADLRLQDAEGEVCMFNSNRGGRYTGNSRAAVNSGDNSQKGNQRIGEEEQFEAATVGQLKYLFSWSVSGSHSSGSLPGGTDGNGNGIPDWWEHYYFGGLIGGAAGGDFSGDGQTVLQHYQNGTAPSRNASAKLSVFTPLEK